MAISVLFVLGLGNVVISLMRNIIPSKIRIIVQLIVVATLSNYCGFSVKSICLRTQ